MQVVSSNKSWNNLRRTDLIYGEKEYFTQKEYFPQFETKSSEFIYPRKDDPMRKALLLLTAATLVAGTALTGSAVAQERSRRAELPANQIADQSAARTARIKADLRLTPEQEGNWAGFETALRDISKTRADREIALRADRTQPKGPVDIIEQMRRGADALSERSIEQKKLAEAAQPLFASLNEQQKRRLTEELVRMGSERDVN
jgi:LTXXQ motif family protein